MTRNNFILAFILLTACSCTTLKTGQSKFVVASNSYTIAVRSVMAAIQEKKIPENKIPAITAAIDAGHQILFEWNQKLAAGKDNPDAAAAIKVIITELTTYYQEKAP